MSSLWTGAFWRDTTERVIVTGAEALLAVITVDGFNLVNFDFTAGAVAVGVAAAASFLKAVIAGGTVQDTVSPASFVKE